MDKQEIKQEEFTFKNFFIPLTTGKAIFWIIVVGLAVYFNSLFNGFVWDDLIYIVNNPEIRSYNIGSIFQRNMFNSLQYYRPISLVYFWFIFSFLENSAFIYHFLQLVLHIVNSILVFWLFKSFFSKHLAFLLSLVFLVHPMQVESVAYIAASNNSHFFFFGIVSLLISLKEKLEQKKLFTIGILLLLSFLTKEAGTLFLLVIVCYRFLFYKRYSKILYIYGTIIALIYICIRFFVGKTYLAHVGTPTIPISMLSLTERLTNVPKIIYYYISTFIFPKNLAIDQLWVVKNINIAQFYFPLIAIVIFAISLIFLTIFLFKKSRENFKIFILFLIWFLGGLLMLLHIVPLDMTVADRWFYLPIVGLLGLIGIAIKSFKFLNKRIKIIYLFIILTLFIFSIRTMVRNANFFDGISLLSHDRGILTNYDLENNLAVEYSKIKEYDKALRHSEISVKLFPYEINLFNLALNYERLGQMNKAKKYYYEALANKHYTSIPQRHLKFTYEGLAWLLLHEDSYKEAKKIINEGLSEYPNEAQLWEDLAICEYRLRDQNQALIAIKKAIQISPDNKEYQGLLLQIQIGNPIEINLFPI
jgi:protein O-mannosyl-transferase